MLETVRHNNNLYAIIIRANYHSEGIEFLTESNYSQQLAYMHHKKGHQIDAHIHNHIDRNEVKMQEVLVIRKGKLRVDFYTDDRNYFGSKIIETGDVILLAFGGHGFEILEEVEMIEIKQGPYMGVDDKTRFEGIDASQIVEL